MRFEKNIYRVKDELVKNRLSNVKENFRGCMAHPHGSQNNPVEKILLFLHVKTQQKCDLS